MSFSWSTWAQTLLNALRVIVDFGAIGAMVTPSGPSGPKLQAFQKTSATHSSEFSPDAAFSESRAPSVQSFRVGLHQSKAPVVVGSIGVAQRLNCEFKVCILILFEHFSM